MKPLSELTNLDELKKLLAQQSTGKSRTINADEMTASLKERVKGQDPVIDDVVRLIKIQWAKERRNRPIANLLFVGPTGTGRKGTAWAAASMPLWFVDRGHFLTHNLQHGGLSTGVRPCIAVAGTSVELASAPWHADLHVAFTDDPALATVRVQISENAETADFAVVDDIDSAEAGACTGTPQLVAISASPSASAPVIFLSPDGPADYRIFVRSKTFTARDAAALIVGASGGHHRLAAASL